MNLADEDDEVVNDEDFDEDADLNEDDEDAEDGEEEDDEEEETWQVADCLTSIGEAPTLAAFLTGDTPKTGSPTSYSSFCVNG